MTRNLERRLQLEERFQPKSEPMIIQLVFVGSGGRRRDGTQIRVAASAAAAKWEEGTRTSKKVYVLETERCIGQFFQLAKDGHPKILANAAWIATDISP